MGSRLKKLFEILECERDFKLPLSNGTQALGAKLLQKVQFVVFSDNYLMTKLTFSHFDGDVSEQSKVEIKLAMHATVTGKAILAWILDTELAMRSLVNGLKRYTPSLITSSPDW